MSEDIFVPKSDPEDALVGPLHTITYVTADRKGVDTVLQKGYGFDAENWFRPSAEEREILDPYFGFSAADNWEACSYAKQGEGANAQIRVLHVGEDMPLVRPSYEGLYRGGATISCPMVDLRAHEKVMKAIDVQSTVGVKEMEFVSPTGETYISAEIVYLAPDNIFIMGVTRPDVFVPVGPIDPATGMGGPAYSARCVTNTDAILDFLTSVMGYEIRRDVNFPVGEKSAINLPVGTTERFIQAFAPGAATGYIVLMDHGEVTKQSGAPQLGPPSRGIGMWSFPTKDIAEVHRRAIDVGIDVLYAPAAVDSPYLGATQTMLLQDPDGFSIEIFEC